MSVVSEIRFSSMADVEMRRVRNQSWQQRKNIFGVRLKRFQSSTNQKVHGLLLCWETTGCTLGLVLTSAGRIFRSRTQQSWWLENPTCPITQFKSQVPHSNKCVKTTSEQGVDTLCSWATNSSNFLNKKKVFSSPNAGWDSVCQETWQSSDFWLFFAVGCGVTWTKTMKLTWYEWAMRHMSLSNTWCGEGPNWSASPPLVQHGGEFWWVLDVQILRQVFEQFLMQKS